MALIDFDWVDITDRKYTGYRYRIKMYDGSGKVDLYVEHLGSDQRINLKMSKAEAEELVVRLQYALYTQENGE